MKKSLFVMLAAVTLMAGNASAVIANLDDIQFWVGTGTNRSALVINFNDGQAKESFAWGFQWNGIASGAEMVIAVANADPNLSISYGGTAASGFFLTSISYDDGVDSHSATNGDFITDFDYWNYYVVGGTAGGSFGPPVVNDPVSPAASFNFPSSWTASPTGASEEAFGDPGRLLVDESWDSWSFGAFPADVPTSAATFAAIPEPSTSLLIGLGSLLLALRRKKV